MLSNEVYEKILNMLMTKELLPGEFINRRQIAEKLGTSVAPVLEAMLILECEGFLESIPRKGTQIRIIRKENVSANLIIRNGIECFCARYYCGKKITANFEKLMQMAVLADNLNFDEITNWKNDLSFHKALIATLENASLLREYERVARPFLFYSSNQFIKVRSISERKLHTELLEGLKVTDPDKAENLLRIHLLSGRKDFF